MTLSLCLRYCSDGIFGLYFSDNDWFLDLMPEKEEHQHKCKAKEEIKVILKAASAGIRSGCTVKGRSVTRSIAKAEQPRDEGDR